MTTNKPNEQKKRVMIVDDSRFNQELLSEILGDAYEYVYADDGAQALDMLSEDERADALLLDMNMPNMSGMEFLKVTSARRWTEEIPVVVISDESDLGVIQNAYGLGAVDYIVRPFNAFLVKRRVENVIVQYSQRKKLAEMVESQIVKREKTNNILVNIFSNIVEMRNSESGGHTLRVQNITKVLLEKLVDETDKYPLTAEDISSISTAAALHDIGKAFVPTDILNKPDKLTAQEWEIMKSHAEKGDEFLKKVGVGEDEKFMEYAREICRSHHERFDGSGYPDGLKGDEIPISAQVVSIADVYDALTSDRCYKKAYPKEEAAAMILNGECGSFNPMLLDCFSEIADELRIVDENKEDDSLEEGTSLEIARDIFSAEEIRVGERSRRLAEYEAKKKDFFACQSGGIQFEYDVERRKIMYMRYYNANGERQRIPAEATRLLSTDEFNEVENAVRKLTPENPTLSRDVLIPINGDMRWHKLIIGGIWGRSDGNYKYIIGQFIDEHEKILSKANGFWMRNRYVAGEHFVALRKVFEVARLVDPKTNKILKITENGDLLETDECCYAIWNRSERCDNCSSAKASESKHWTSKLEMKGGKIYTVVSRQVVYKDKVCVLELAFNMDEAIENAKDEVGYGAIDAGIFKKYYRDAVTKIYSRVYFDNFQVGFENAKGMAMIDLDKFKSINDRYGHVVGDEALRHVAKIVKLRLGNNDELIRYGGDEFLLACFDISEENFFKKLQEIKLAVKESKMEEYPEVKISISIGGAYGVRPLKRAIDLADKEMYKDKFRVEE